MCSMFFPNRKRCRGWVKGLEVPRRTLNSNIDSHEYWNDAKMTYFLTLDMRPERGFPKPWALQGLPPNTLSHMEKKGKEVKKGKAEKPTCRPLKQVFQYIWGGDMLWSIAFPPWSIEKKFLRTHAISQNHGSRYEILGDQIRNHNFSAEI